MDEKVSKRTKRPHSVLQNNPSLKSPPSKKAKETSTSTSADGRSDIPSSTASTKIRKASHQKADETTSSKGAMKVARQPICSDREQAYTLARDYVKAAGKLPITIGNTTVECLGTILVDKNNEPTFHTAYRLWPIGYRAIYKDPLTKIEYFCEVLDGMDTDFMKNAPAFKVHMKTNEEHVLIANSASNVWKAVKEVQETQGTPTEQEAAKKWNLKDLSDRFGLHLKEVRKRLEGLPGANECSKYQFLSLKKCAKHEPSAKSQLSSCKKIKANCGKKNEDVPKPSVRKSSQEFLRSKGFLIFHSEVIEQMKSVGDKSTGIAQQKKIIAERWAELSDSNKQKYHAKAIGESGVDSDPGRAGGEADVAVQTNTTIYRDEGPFIGEKARRFIFNEKDQPVDVADGVIFGWLPLEDQGDDIYTSEETGAPAALWRIKFEDAVFGDEDLEEHEVIEAISLRYEPLNEKMQQKYDKRQERLAQKKARLVEKRAEKERLRMQKEAGKALFRPKRDNLGQFKEKFLGSAPNRPKDECFTVIPSGPCAGLLAMKVPFPSGSSSFPPAEHAAEFMTLYAFLRDLSGPLGAVRMSFEELIRCFSVEEVEKISSQEVAGNLADSSGEKKSESDLAAIETERDGLECFCELALWLTRLAVRSKFIREDEEFLDSELNLVKSVDCGQDIKLAPGPLLSPDLKDSETISYTCWHLANESSWPAIVKMLIKTSPLCEDHGDLLDALDRENPSDFSLKTRMELASFLRDEVCASDKVRDVMNHKVRDIESLQERKRAEDAALRKSKEAGKSKVRAENVSAETQGDGTEAGVKSRPLPAFDLMKNLHQLDHLPFETKFQGKSFNAVLDCSGTVPVLVSGKEVYSSPVEWISKIRSREKIVGMSVKSLITFKGKTLRDWEPDVAVKVENTVKVDNEKEAKLSVDEIRRREEFDVAMSRIEKGFRVRFAGLDRLLRRYWCFDGLTDRVWVSCAASRSEHVSTAELEQDCNYGFDGTSTAGFKNLRDLSKDVWTCFSRSDGSLQQLYEYLKNGPKGEREMQLLEQLRKFKVEAGFCGSEDDKNEKEKVSGRPEEEGAYEWKHLPRIGDVVWARKGDDVKSAMWYPVVVVDPEAELPLGDDGQGSVSGDDEWHTSGSEYIGKRVLLSIFDNRKNKQATEMGKIIGWLPADVSDFKSEATGENAPLWRVKLDDKAFSHQDLEEFEVKEAMKNFAKTEALKKCKDSEFLSRRSMFGQKVKWLYGQFMDDRKAIEVFPLQNTLPYLEFRETRIQQMSRINKAKVKWQVELANAHIEEHSAGRDQPDDWRLVLKELGLSPKVEQRMTEQLQASCRNCLQHPRVLTVVQDTLDRLPFIPSIHELRRQLCAIYSKMQISFLQDEEFVNALQDWRSSVEQVDSVADMRAAVLQLEEILCSGVSAESEDEWVVPEDEKWRTEGNEWIGQRLRRAIKGRFGHIVSYAKAKVVGWLPAEESEFLDDLKRPAPLWHILWDDGDEEDLEAFEVHDSIRSFLDAGEVDGRRGVWDSARDRETWVRLASGARTLACIALGLYFLGDRALNAVQVLTMEARFQNQEWDDHCFISGDGGSLMCCEACPRTVLPASLGLTRAPKGDFFCPYCLRHQKRRSSHGASARQQAVRNADASKKVRTAGGPDPLERMRKSIVRHGVHDGSICEVVADGTGKRDERQFVKVLDGHIVDKDSDDPAIKTCQYFSEWRTKDPRRLYLTKKRGPVPVSMVLQAGSVAQLLEGDGRSGFVPVGGI